MTINNMRIEDHGEIYALWLSCAGMGLNDVDDSIEGIEKFLERNPETCFVAREGDAIIGVIMAGNDGRRGFIYHTAVSQAHRHKGVGTALVASAMASLKKLGITKVALVAKSANSNGNAFWEKMGFTVRNDLTYRNKALAELRRIDT